MLRVVSKKLIASVYQLYLPGTQTVLEEIEDPDDSIAKQRAREIGQKKYWGENGPTWGLAVRMRQVRSKDKR